MTWSSSQIDSLPGGVRALPRSLRLAWVGAASSAKGRGLSVADARKHGDATVELINRGLADIGLQPEALEGWAKDGSHPLLLALQSDSLEQAIADATDLVGDPHQGERGSLADWLAEQLKPAAPLPSRNDVTELATKAALSTGSASPRKDAQWRVDRIEFDLTDEGKDAVERALSRARKLEQRGDSASFESIIEQLRKDGFDDYITPEGYLKVRVRAARSGTQIYSNGFETWGEYRPPEEVFSALSLASWGLKPFTNDHPPDFVGAHNWGQYAVGVVADDATRVAAPDGDDYVEVTIVVYGWDALVAIRGGKLELSAGYTAKLVQKKGRDSKGREYLFWQTEIWINHLSLVDRGRAGPLAKVSFDGLAWQVTFAADGESCSHTKTEDTTMSTPNIPMIKVDLADGVSVELTQDQADRFKAAEQKRIADEADKRAKEYVSAAKAEADAKDKPAIDAMQAQIKDLGAKIDGVVSAKAETDAKLVSLQAENAALKADADARQRADVMATIATTCPKLDLSKLEGAKAGDPARICDLKAAAICDLNPSFASAIAEYRKQGDGFERFVDSLFAVEIGKAKTGDRSPIQAPASGPVSTTKVDLNSLRNASLGQPTSAPN